MIHFRKFLVVNSSFPTRLDFQQTYQQARTAELMSNFDLFERF